MDEPEPMKPSDGDVWQTESRKLWNGLMKRINAAAAKGTGIRITREETVMLYLSFDDAGEDDR